MKFVHVLLMLALIAGGYFIRDVVDPNTEAEAKVADMDYRALQQDRDFLWAVSKTVERLCHTEISRDKMATSKQIKMHAHSIQCIPFGDEAETEDLFGLERL